MEERYEELRAHLSRQLLLPALTGVYRLSLFLTNDTPLPPWLDNPAFHGRSKLEIGVTPWELETLARQMILHCPLHDDPEPFDYPSMATAVNLVKRIENDAWNTGRRGPDIFYELIRIAHRQFAWQQGFDQEMITRFYRLFRDPAVEAIVMSVFRMTAEEMLALGIAVARHFYNQMAMVTPVTNDLNSVPIEAVNAFIERFAKPLDDLRDGMASVERLDINWAYAFNHLRAHPLVRLTDTIVIAPIPALLLYRLTDGLYFDLVDQRGFANAFGNSFQRYVGDVVIEAREGERLSLLPEQRYGTRARPKDSIDWIVEDETATLFVECKASRMRFQGKTDLAERGAMDEEIGRLASFVVQVYATLSDALSGLYPHWQPRCDRPVYPLIVTLDEWHAFGDVADRVIGARVRESMAERGLNLELIDRHPYQICSIVEFEMLVQIVAQSGVDSFMAEKTVEARRWPFHNFMVEFIRRRGLGLRVLFASDYDSLGGGPDDAG